MDLNLRPTRARGRSPAPIVRRAIWLAVALISATAFFGFGLVFRVLMGPVSLGPFSGELHAALEQVLPGLDVHFDDAALEWNRDEGRINVVIMGTRVFDRNQHIIAQAPKAEIGLAVAPFLRGHIVVSRIALVGVQLTLVHTRIGTLRLGIEPGTAGDDVLQRIRDAISHNRGGSSLRSFAVRQARLAFYDEETAAFVVAPEADLQVTRSNRGSTREGGIDATVAARIEISGSPAHIYANFDFPDRGDLTTGDISITGLNLAALASDGHGFAFLAPFGLKADVTGSWTVARGTDLKFVDFGIGAAGDVNGLGRPLHVKSLRLVGRYDGATGRLVIDDASLAGEQTRAHLTGTANLRFDRYNALDAAAFALSLDRLGFDMPGAMQRPVKLGRATIKGNYTASDQSIVFEQLLLSGGPLSGALGGRVAFARNQSPELDLDGRVDAIGVRELLPYWPLHLVAGARSWIDANVSAGRLGPILIHTRIPAGALDRPAIPDNAVSVTFPLVGATIRYLRGLTPLTSVAATGILAGDTFSANITSAAVGKLAVTQGRVTIAHLHQDGAPADITAHVVGALPQFLSLLDMKPLQYPTRFHIDTASAQGAAAFDATFRVPTIRGESVDAIRISVKGSVNQFALSLGPHTQISDGALGLSVDNANLRATGRLDLNGAPLDADWTEAFKPRGPVSTRMTFRGTFDDAARAAFGLPPGQFLSGPVGVEAYLEGYRGTVQRALLHLDLDRATLAADVLAWRKAAGVPANAQVSAQVDPGGNPRAADFEIAGPSLSARGTATFGPTGSLETLIVPAVRAGAANDFGVVIKEQPGSGLDIAVTGHSLDASGLGRRKSGPGAKEEGRESSEPFHLSARLDKLALRDDMDLSSFLLEASGVGEHPRTLSASGNLTKTAPLAASITGDSQRRLAATAGDAGLLISGLLGYSIIKGGELSLQATLPPIGAISRTESNTTDFAGELVIRNCTILNQPFLTRLFSSGSFGGFMDLMRGQGIALDSVHIPFRVDGDIITIHDAHASGPSIGVTADGYIDRSTNQIALQGALAPLYGINGLLGVIPVLGNVFVSKRGEGLFGVTYTVQGDIDQPKVSTNPLSVLAPGILRRLFEGSTPRPASSAASSTPRHTQ